MNMLERLLGHDHDTTRQFLMLCLPLSDEQLDRDFDAGWRTLRATFQHMIGNIEIWTNLMLARPLRRKGAHNSVPELIERLDRACAEFAELALRLEREGRLDDTWTDTLDNPPQDKSFGGAIGHVITHNMHHRAELLHMLHRLPMDNLPEGELMGWEMRRNG